MRRVPCPRSDADACDTLEIGAKGTVTAVAALLGQLLKRALFTVLSIKGDEMLDAQSIDIGVVCDALLGKVTAQIGTVGTDDKGQLCQRDVVL